MDPPPSPPHGATPHNHTPHPPQPEPEPPQYNTWVTSNSFKNLHTINQNLLAENPDDSNALSDESVKNPCPLCPAGDFCICGTCDECIYILSEKGFNIHIMNDHEPPDVKKHFGMEWIKAHKNHISRNYADSAQDRYHSKKWDSFVVL
jgi:hypothetical protein